MTQDIELTLEDLEGFGEAFSYAPEAVATGAGFGAMFGILAAFYFVLILFSIAMYIMQAIAFMKMAKKTGVRNGWLSFIPIGDIYIIGRVADAGKENRKNTRRLMGTMIALAIVYALFIVVMVAVAVSAPFSDTFPAAYIAPMIIVTLVLMVIAICLSVFEFIAFYAITQNFGGENAMGYFIGILVAMFLMPIVAIVLFLILSGKTPKFTDAPVAIPEAATQTDSVF